MSRKTLDARRLGRLLDGFSRVRVLVLGDVVLDEYLWGEALRISPEAPVPIVHVARESVVLGGAGNVLRNVIALGARADFVSVVGADPDGRQVIDLVKDVGVETSGVLAVEGRPTTRKTRVVARAQQIVRFDRETTHAISVATRREVARAVEATLPRVDAVVIEDYGKGLLTQGLIRELLRRARQHGVPVVVDPKRELAAYKGAALLKPSLREAEAMTGLRMRGPADLERIAAVLRRRCAPGDIAITRGGEGMTIFEEGRDGQSVPTLRREVFDVQGAGDTTIAALALAGCAGASLREAAVIANAAAGVVVAKMGTATADRDEVRALLPVALRAALECS